MIVGEIGIPRREFLYDIDFWEARRIIRGYQRRCRDAWSMTRWHAFNIMAAMPYCDLKKAGIYSPSDLIAFPWDERRQDLPSEEEEEQIMQELERLRKLNMQVKSAKSEE